MIDAYVVLDLEMSGLSAKQDHIIEIGAIKVVDHKVVEEYSCLVNAHCHIPDRVVELTGITEEMMASGEESEVAIAKLLDFIEGYTIVGQNVSFDYSFLKQWAVNHKRPLELQAWDTLKIARALLPAEQPKKLSALCEYFGIPRGRGHRALDDTKETWQVFEALIRLAEKTGEPEKYLMPQPLRYQAKKQTPATARQLQRLREYIERHQIQDVIDWDGLTRSEASRITDKYISRYGK